ncbi:AAA family ATPase [Agromyces sp. CFH 90414]|uniref:AAA family ATPase n=1 Tax=Agromyces agglutinans TaxID=2662258 RepID=A0A6I2F896_9MICO|nr:AAA family ATPase [Agromyces agglutinans]
MGRSRERQALDRLLAEARDGRGAVAVVRGEAGVGKTALLRYCAHEARDLQIHRTSGVESEMQLPFASLHQLCRPLLGHLESIPHPQRIALSVALGLIDGASPDPFLVSLAALSLLSEVAAAQPMLCLIDDAQWLDSASGQALAFVARRLLADSVAMVFAVREPTTHRELAGLPELQLQGLDEDDARVLLEMVIPGRFDPDIRNRLLAETRGNPLALLELPNRLDSTQLPGVFGLRDGQELPRRIEEAFRLRLLALSREARLLLLLAAAEPADDPHLLWRAAERLGIPYSAAEATEAEGLLAIDRGVRFRHPLVRSAVYGAATAHDRRSVHLALAEATDPRIDPDRRAWHLAAAAIGPDEAIALELERSAGRARARGGLSAAAAFLRRSALLTSNSDRRVGRALAAAQASLHAGEFESALHVLSTVDAAAPDELQAARVDLLRAQVISASGAVDAAPALLLAAAERLEPLDPVLARESYLDAWGAALFAGKLANADMREVSRVVRDRADPNEGSLAADLLLDGMSTLMTDGRAAAAPILRRGIAAFLAEDLSLDKGMRWSVIASCAAVEVWDFESWDAVITRQMQLARDAGALAPLAFGLNGKAITVAWTGDFAATARVDAEADAVTQATGSRVAPFGGMLFAALRGRATDAFELLDRTVQNSGAAGAGFALQWVNWTTAMLCNGLGRYEDALSAAQRAWDDWPDWYVSILASAELVEAAARLGRPHLGAEPLTRLVESARVGASDWALGIAERCTALLIEDGEAEAHYQAAIGHLAATPLRPELARAHLVYGEWLRREKRRLDARGQLRVAHSMLAEMGAEGFAERARHELSATGAKVRRRVDANHDELTPQEAHVARLAADGGTNIEIGTELYLSPRTVEWHLKKVYLKLGITSRRALRAALLAREPGRAAR